MNVQPHLTPEGATELPANAALTHAAHFTITSLVLGGPRQFGFAARDDGQEVYVPAGIIHHYNLTSADIGAGFRALTRAPQTVGRHPQVVAPLYFDRDFPDIRVAGSDYSGETLTALRESTLPLVRDLAKRVLLLERMLIGARD